MCLCVCVCVSVCVLDHDQQAADMLKCTVQIVQGKQMYLNDGIQNGGINHSASIKLCARRHTQYPHQTFKEKTSVN